METWLMVHWTYNIKIDKYHKTLLEEERDDSASTAEASSALAHPK